MNKKVQKLQEENQKKRQKIKMLEAEIKANDKEIEQIEMHETYHLVKALDAEGFAAQKILQAIRSNDAQSVLTFMREKALAQQEEKE